METEVSWYICYFSFLFEKNYVLYWYFDLKSWIVDFFTRFTLEKTPQKNFSCQNFSVENNYFSLVSQHGKWFHFFSVITGWTYNHLNIPRVKFLTTTQGIGLCVGDLINFYVDPKMEAVPYTGVACNVDVLKHVENMSKGKGKKRRRRNSSVKSKVRVTTTSYFISK